MPKTQRWAAWAMMLVLIFSPTLLQAEPVRLEPVGYRTECRPNVIYPERMECESHWEDETPSYSGPCDPVGGAIVFGMGFGMIGALFGYVFQGSAMTGGVSGALLGAAMGYGICSFNQSKAGY